MIISHPFMDRQEEQEALLESLPNNKREYQSLKFSYDNACYRYYNLSAMEVKLTEEDFDGWLLTLSDILSQAMRRRGFNDCTNMMAFKIYVSENNQVGMDEYVRSLMGDENYHKVMEVV
jgi:hypothetical protein